MNDDHTALHEAASLAFTRAFQGVLKIEADGHPPFWIDGRNNAPVILENAPKNNESCLCIWTSSPSTLKRALDGERAVESAYISGRLSIQGDFSVMARLKMEKSL